MLRAALLVHDLLARVLLPPRFRSEFGEEIAVSLRARLEARRSLFGVVTVTALELLDLERTALREWWAVATGGSGVVHGVWSDIRIAARSLSRARTFTMVTATTLAMPIGVNTAIYSVVDAVLIDPLPFPEADRLVVIEATAPGTDMPQVFNPAIEFFVQYSEKADLLEDLAIYVPAQATARAGEHVEQLFMIQGTHSLFPTLGVSPVLGRLPGPGDEPGSVVLISHQLWTSWLASDSTVLGRPLDIAGRMRTVIGVMASDFRFPDDRTSIWIFGAPLGDPSQIRPGGWGFHFVGRMRPDVSHEDLTEQLAPLARRLPERFGGSPQYARIIERHRPVVRSLEEAWVGDVSHPLRLLFGTVAVVLLVACANVANLFGVRAESRQRELSVRRALGAGRGRLVRIQMVEALILAALGGAAGGALAWVGLPLLIRAAPDNVPNLDAARLDAAALLFAAGASLLAACAFGLLPALRSSRPRPIGALRSTGRPTEAPGNVGRMALVTAQTASALVLLVGSGLLVRSYWTLSRVDPGYHIDDIFTFQMAPERDELHDGPSYARFHQAFMERIAALPGVESVGLISRLPLDEGYSLMRIRTERTRSSGEDPLLGYTRVGGDYFATMGIALEQGRLFEPSDHDGTGNVLLSRSAADLLWPHDNPIGKTLMTSLDTVLRHTVVGIVEDVLVNELRETEPMPMVYVPLVGPTPESWAVRSPAYVVKSERAASMASDVRALIREMVPESPLYRAYTMEALAARSLAALHFTMLMLALASALALTLGAVGLYGVLSYVVSLRAPEIAVRMAVGAEAHRVRRMVVVEGARLTLAGVLVGLGVAVVVTRMLDSLLFGVGALDLPTFAAMASVMVVVALLASWVPAFRASAVDPMIVLRSD